MGKGALSGAISGALSEVIAEQLTPNMAASFDEKLAEKEAELGRHLTHAEAKEEHEQFVEEIQSSIEFKARMGAAFATALLKQDVHITDSAAENAIKNNWLNFVISAGMMAWSGYEAFETYKKLVSEGKTVEEAQRTAVLQFGQEALIALVGGAIAGRILRALKTPGSKVLDMLIAESPVLQKIATRAGVALESVSTKARSATDVAKNTAQKAKDTAKGAFRKSATKAEASAAGKASSTFLESQRHIEQMMKDQLSKMPEMAEYMTPKTVQQVMKEIGIDAGKRYDLGYLRNQTLGWIAEKRGIKTLQRAGYELIESKLPGNKGFDAVGIKRAANGEIIDIMIVESKFSAKGGVKLARYEGMGGRKFSQMSDDWIRGVLDRMGASSNQGLKEISHLIRTNKASVTRKLNVLDSAGKTNWQSAKLPKTQDFKK